MVVSLLGLKAASQSVCDTIFLSKKADLIQPVFLLEFEIGILCICLVVPNSIFGDAISAECASLTSKTVYTVHLGAAESTETHHSLICWVLMLVLKQHIHVVHYTGMYIIFTKWLVRWGGFPEAPLFLFWKWKTTCPYFRTPSESVDFSQNQFLFYHPDISL